MSHEALQPEWASINFAMQNALAPSARGASAWG